MAACLHEIVSERCDGAHEDAFIQFVVDGVTTSKVRSVFLKHAQVCNVNEKPTA